MFVSAWFKKRLKHIPFPDNNKFLEVRWIPQIKQSLKGIRSNLKNEISLGYNRIRYQRIIHQHQQKSSSVLWKVHALHEAAL